MTRARAGALRVLALGLVVTTLGSGCDELVDMLIDVLEARYEKDFVECPTPSGAGYVVPDGDAGPFEYHCCEDLVIWTPNGNKLAGNDASELALEVNADFGDILSGALEASIGEGFSYAFVNDGELRAHHLYKEDHCKDHDEECQDHNEQVFRVELRIRGVIALSEKLKAQIDAKSGAADKIIDDAEGLGLSITYSGEVEQVEAGKWRFCSPQDHEDVADKCEEGKEGQSFDQPVNDASGASWVHGDREGECGVPDHWILIGACCVDGECVANVSKGNCDANLGHFKGNGVQCEADLCKGECPEQEEEDEEDTPEPQPDVVADASGEPDAGGPSDVGGGGEDAGPEEQACANPKDQAQAAELDAESVGTIFVCALECLGAEDAACGEVCVAGALGLSTPCSACLADFGACVVEACEACLEDPTGEACGLCVAESPCTELGLACGLGEG